MSDALEGSSEPGCSQSKELVIRRNDEEKREDNDRQIKRVKVMPNEHVFIQNIPSCSAYEKSYDHQETLSHVYVTKSQFLITASNDGIIKFWKKTINGIEFVKKFKSHASSITDISVTQSGSELVSISKQDSTAKIFDIINFDMINMFSLKFEPNCVEWINSFESSNENFLISDSKSPNIYIFDARQSTGEPKRVINEVHRSTICRIRFNFKYKTIVSADEDGTMEFWRISDSPVGFSRLNTSKPDRDEKLVPTCFSEFKPNKIKVHHISFTQDGEYFVTTSSDRIIRIFRYKSRKLVRTYDETLERIEETQKTKDVKFAIKMSTERSTVQASLHNENAIFDETGNFVLFPSMSGVKVYNWRTNRFIRSLGENETTFRPIFISLFQGLVFEKAFRKFNIESLESGISDPTLFCTAHNKNRFYCFSHRYFEEGTTEGEGGEIIRDRDIFTEKPKREQIVSAVDLDSNVKSKQKNHDFEFGIIHTTMGDLHIKLFPKQAPKTCENFCTHAKNNYYNNHIFHRVIKGFMIQTGDPTGTGTGGESIWGDDFEDEFCDEFSHATPFMVSMANCGPNTNGSQFFITVAPCSNLDRKHTIFGKVTRGMDICKNISQVKTDPKTDKPLKDIKIINIKVS